jgi:hypothetical protein
LLDVVEVALVIGPAVDVDADRILAAGGRIAHGVDVGGTVHVTGSALHLATERLQL